MTDQPTWELVEDAATRLSARGDGVFRLGDIIEYVQSIDARRPRTSIQPIVQGMTVNAGKGPPSPCGRILRRVEHGLYVLDRATGADAARTDADAGLGSQEDLKRIAPAASAGRVRELADRFGHFIDVFDRSPPFRRVGQLESHRSTIELRRQLGSVDAAIESASFVESLRHTLYAWGIGKRASRLAPVERIRDTLRAHRIDLQELEHLVLEELREPDVERVSDAVYRLVASLDIVDNDARIVAGTKALHHLLPDLVPPMDRAWTGRFFSWSPVDTQYRQHRTFARSFIGLAEVARVAKPSKFVGNGWRTSSTKVLDNGVVGSCLEHGLAAPPREGQG